MTRKKILFVCTGNTCRSPMAELILRSKLKERNIDLWEVDSCGIRAEIGNPISSNSKIALDEISVSFDGFTPKQLNQKLIKESDLVVTMTAAHKQLLDGCGNIICMKDICGIDIPDPYGCDAQTYKSTRDAICAACEILINEYILTYKENT